MIYTADAIDRINNAFTPNPNQKIARYIGFNNFKRLIDSKSLWLSNSAKFMDENEGEIPLTFFEKWEKESADNYSTLQKLKAKVFQSFISCWFAFENESETMWLSYGGERIDNQRNSKGVCIVTDVSKLEDCSRSLDTRIYKVQYIDYGGTDLVQPPFYFSLMGDTEHPGFNGRVFFAYKQKEYQDEKEIRAITYKNLSAKGICAKIEPNNFIDNIIINPHATIEEKEEIEAYIKKSNLESKLIDSKIRCRY